MTILQIVFFASGVVSIVLLAAHTLVVRMDIRHLNRKTSRFPLFAARDYLIQLVAEGIVSENEPAWQDIYEGVNSLLNLDEQWHLRQVIKLHIQHQQCIISDKNFSKKWKKRLDQREKLIERCPRFAEIDRQVQNGFLCLVRERTPKVQFFYILAAVVLLSLILRGVVGFREAIRLFSKSSNLSDYNWREIDSSAAS
jgi:hypothetical protein